MGISVDKFQAQKQKRQPNKPSHQKRPIEIREKLVELTTTVPGLEEPQPITEDIPYNTQSYFVKITNRNPREKNYRLLRRHVYFVTHAPGWTSWQQDSMLFSPPKQKFRTNCWENVAEMSRALL